MMFKKHFLNIIILLCLIKSSFQFEQRDEASYMAHFSTLIKDSYSEDLPSNLKSACKNQASSSSNLPIKLISKSIKSSELQNECGFNSICTIEPNAILTMDSNLNLAALVIKGMLNWTDQSQASNEQWLCAGYIAVLNFILIF